MQVGDVILSFDGTAVEDTSDLYNRITESQPGESKPLSVLRGGEVIQPLTVTLSEAGKTSVD